jgi:hypothetical protein
MNPAENWQTAAEPPPIPAAPAPAVAAPAAIGRKNPALAAFLSLFPGIGNVYNGLYMRGFTFFLIISALIGISADTPDGEPFVFAVFFFWLVNVIDAYRQATLINYGYAQDLGLTDLPRRLKASQGGLVAGILLAAIGLIALLERYTIISLEWIFDLWPFALLLLGGWLIYASLRDRRRSQEGG